MQLTDSIMQLSPEIVLLLGACATLLLGAFKGVARQPWPSAFAFMTLACALAITLKIGQPEQPVALAGLWITSITYFTRLVVCCVGLAAILINWHQPVEEERGEFMSLMLFSLLGVLLTASANDWIILFFAIELVSVPTYVLIALSRTDQRSSESAVKYFFLGALSAAILAYGLSFLYGASGTTTILQVTGTTAVPALPHDGAMVTFKVIGLLLVLGGLAFKIAAVPFHAYVADVYEGAASSVTGFLGFAPKMAGFLALIKVLTACDWDISLSMYWVLWCMAAFSMTFGNVLALLQTNVKRMLAYSGIAHSGYMLVGVLIGPVVGSGPMQDGVAAVFFYISIYGLMNLGVFAVFAGFRRGDREVETLSDLSGLALKAPLAALALAICVFSLMGLPPTGGFLGKLYVFGSAFSLDADHVFRGPVIALIIIGVLNTAIGAAYYLRIVATVFFGQEESLVEERGGAPVRLGLAICCLPLLLFFAWPGGLRSESLRATNVLHDSIKPGRSRLASSDPGEAQLDHVSQSPVTRTASLKNKSAE